jgi:hypothetical protein
VNANTDSRGFAGNLFVGSQQQQENHPHYFHSSTRFKKN